ncbi:MAG: hypothetical protein ABJA74_00020 [Lapillicoccus sp.]
MTPGDSPGRLFLDDGQGYADLRTFVMRARSLDEDGAVRLQAKGTVLAGYVGVLPGRGLMGDGAVMGLRTMRLGRPATLDATVSLAALADRLNRDTSHGLELPPVTVQTAWAAMTPPRGGWEPVGSLAASMLVDAARAGIAEVATGTAPGSGAHAVTDLRHRVWGRLTETVPPVPAGAAFAAYSLGFVDPADPTLRCDIVAHGRWTRLSSPRGHVLVR